jgi:hypothetical protein
MLRRNFLKFIGLLPFGAKVLKADTKRPEYKLFTSKEVYEEIKQLLEPKYYAKVRTTAVSLQECRGSDGSLIYQVLPASSYTIIELELEEGCSPKIGDTAWKLTNGKCVNEIIFGPELKFSSLKRKLACNTNSDIFPIGVFITERYTKEQSVEDKMNEVLDKHTIIYHKAY